MNRVLSHLRGHVVAYIALFIALGGTAYAAKPPVPLIGTAGIENESLLSEDIHDGSLTGADVQDNSLKGADVDESTLSGVNADKLDGLDSADYGAVMSGRINGLTDGTQYGSATGISTASATEDPVMTLTPDHALVARDLSVQLTAPVSDDINDINASRGFKVFINHENSLNLRCVIGAHEGDHCTNHGSLAVVPANSTISIRVDSLLAAPADALFAFRLTPVTP
jgi:hypothetical protein